MSDDKLQKCADCEKPIGKLAKFIDTFIERGTKFNSKQATVLGVCSGIAAYAGTACISVVNHWHEGIWPWDHPGSVLCAIGTTAIIFLMSAF